MLKYDQLQLKVLHGERKALLKAFGENRTLALDNQSAQTLVKKRQECIAGNYYTRTKEIFADLGIMYAGNERFKTNIDKCGEIWYNKCKYVKNVV